MHGKDLLGRALPASYALSKFSAFAKEYGLATEFNHYNKLSKYLSQMSTNHNETSANNVLQCFQGEFRGYASFASPSFGCQLSSLA